MSAETSAGVAPERLKSTRDFSCSLEIPTGSSKFRLLRCMLFRRFRQSYRMGRRHSVLRCSLLFLRAEPDFHYKRSSRSFCCLLRAKGEHWRGHLPVVIRLVDLSLMTFPETKLRELRFWTLVSLHRCSTFRFL